MTPLSVVKSINKRAAEIRKYFGEYSVEYMKIKSLIFSYVGQTDFLLREERGKPLALSRTKRAQAAYPYIASTLDELWYDIKKYGTVKQLRKEYVYEPVMDESGTDTSSGYSEVVDYDDPEVIEYIRQASFEAYEAVYADTDLYTKVNDEITKEAMLPSDERDEEYLNGLEYVLTILHESGKSMQNKMSRAWAYYTRIKLEHEERLRTKAEMGKGEHELGGNE